MINIASFNAEIKVMNTLSTANVNKWIYDRIVKIP